MLVLAVSDPSLDCRQRILSEAPIVLLLPGTRYALASYHFSPARMAYYGWLVTYLYFCWKMSTWVGNLYSPSRRRPLRPSLEICGCVVGAGGRRNVFIASGLSTWPFVAQRALPLAQWPILLVTPLALAAVLLVSIAPSLLLSARGRAADEVYACTRWPTQKNSPTCVKASLRLAGHTNGSA